MKWLKWILGILAAVFLTAALFLIIIWQGSKVSVDGRVSIAELERPVDILRDRWGVPHIFAEKEGDAWFALGYAAAQDRLFQMDLVRRAARGRLAELFGPKLLDVDKLYRTMNFFALGQRLMDRASPEVRESIMSYTRGINAYLHSRGRIKTIEHAILFSSVEPFQEMDLLGMLGIMTWNLNMSWEFDPLFEQIVSLVGLEKARQLLPTMRGGRPANYVLDDQTRARALETVGRFPEPTLFHLSPESRRFLNSLPAFTGSNNWVVAPSRSASGGAILANDPHLSHNLPGIWYQAHIKVGDLDIIGVTIPGLPFVVIGHNREIAWGFTNLMVDAGDFFLERINPENPDQVMFQGKWVTMETRREVFKIKGGKTEELLVRVTPHGPIVNDLMEGETRALSFQWVLDKAGTANELDGFYRLNRARDWKTFREALSLFGAAAQNVAYADRKGNIGLQAAGRIPRLKGRSEGTFYRIGWDGSEEWNGFIPFEQNPSRYNPSSGWLASANNPPYPEPDPYYITAWWEPMDRILRIRELLAEKEKLSVADMKRIQNDVVWISAREFTPMILAAWQEKPTQSETTRRALALLRDWKGEMLAESPAAAIFAVFFNHLIQETLEDELGPKVIEGLRQKGNIPAIMIRALMAGGPEEWFDRTDTPELEDRAAIIRAALEKALAELTKRLGGKPEDWAWGRLHTVEFVNPLGQLPALSPFFNVGPFPMPGHANTVNKMQSRVKDYQIDHGPSMRQITDLSDLEGAQAVIPTGQSGVRSSPHYGDLAPLWVEGRYHPFPMARAAVEKITKATLRLEPYANQ